MNTLSTSAFLWRIAGGFLVGVVGMATLVPAATATLVQNVAEIAHVR